LPTVSKRDKKVTLPAAALLLSCLALRVLAAEPTHPLDPLRAEEITAAAGIVRESPGLPGGAVFSTIVLNEPSKPTVLGFKPGRPFPREAFVVVYDGKGDRTFEAIIDLRSRKTTSWNEIVGVEPLVFFPEYESVPLIVKADRRWQEAMRKRGITDFDKVQIDTWAVGDAPAGEKGRLVRGLSYLKDGMVNFYGRPIEGVVAVVNTNTRKVVELVDTGIVPLAPRGQELDEKSIGRQREAPKPLTISQPNGNSFELQGNEIRWQNWKFRYTMHPREGLVLHTVDYEDQGKLRSVLYRAALSEMVVPYGNPDPTWRWRSAFDVGEYAVGRMASPLEARVDAPENAFLVDAVFADESGKPYTLQRAVGLYERDGGILWKHYDSYTAQNESRRARQLVILFVATIGNYDYAINWIFNQDGTIEIDAALSGILLSKGVGPAMGEHAAGDGSGPLVSPGVVAPHHQHFFNFRLDLDVDGVRNSVVEMNTRAIPPERQNPSANGMTMEETMLRRELAAGRSMKMESARTWSVRNSSAKNSLGQPASFILVPGANSVPYAAPSSSVRKRAGFINRHFWVTRYRAGEMNAAGAYPNQSKGGDGLPAWVSNNEPIENEDIVLWYTMGITHIPRPEEWPVMPVTHVGFKLIPGGFFSRNPALDVPR
jgi:primary-amine oxidase